MFKLQHPQDLVSRLFILEYIKELGPNTIKEKLTDGEANFWLYKFEGEEKIEYDFNWEYLLFVIPLSNLSHIMERYLDEVEKIEQKRQSKYNKYKELYFELWNRIREEEFIFEFYKDKRFPQMPILSCAFWD